MVGVVSYNSRGYSFLMFTGISAGFPSLYPRGNSFPRFRGFIRGNPSSVPARWLFSALPRVYSRVFFPCTRAAALFRVSAGLSARFLSLYPRGTIPHIIPNYPRAHYNAGLNTSAAVCRRRYLVSVRNLSIRCACNQTRVCRRKCSGRRLFILLPQIPLLQLFLNLPVSG